MKKKLAILVLLVFALGISYIPATFAEETLVAAIESEGVELYDVGEGNFLLRCEGVSEPFELVAHPWRAEPQLRVFDYDQDGEKELAVSFFTGGGTGVSIEELYFFKKQDGKLVECPYAPEGYANLLKKEIGFKAFRENERLFLEFSTANNSLRFDVTDDLGEEFVADSARKLECGDIISFRLEDGGSVTMKAPVGTLVSSSYVPDYYADVTAKIIFTNGKAELADVHIVAPD